MLSPPKMQFLNPSSSCFPSFLSISSFIFIFVFIIISPTSFSQDYEDLFRNCSSVFSCGENFPNITYPFWGGNKSSDCGLEGFYLNCQEDNHPTIEISRLTFRVVNISRTSYSITIAQNDLWNGACPVDVRNRGIDSFVFRPGREVENLTLSYGCPDAGNSRNQFDCRGSNGYPTNVLFMNVSGCESNISVLALQSEVDELRSNDRAISLQDVLYEGFDVEYNLNRTACFPCEISGGVCWSGTNSTGSCLCSDGLHDHICPRGRGSRVPRKIVIGVGSSVSAFLFCFVLFLCTGKRKVFNLFMFRRKTKEDRNLEAFLMKYGSLAPVRYRYSDIKRMTMSFKEKLGEGGYGTVYKGKLSDGRLVAVKILKVLEGDGEEFINEVLSICRTSHVNVVTFLGFCLEGKRRALIYEYMPNGSLEKFIHSSKNSIGCNQLGMDKLHQISLGVARGLDYLHRGCNTRILHFDIKPHNILLDEDFCPKISDFGLAKQCKNKDSIVSIVDVRGTIGYIAPELVCRSFGGVSYKSDVYSYGMMILEIVGRRKNVSYEASHSSEVFFPHWAYQHLVVDNDLRLKGVVTPEKDEIARKIILVGLWCIQNDPSVRPAMSKVIEMLEGDLQAIPMPPKAFFGSPSTTPQSSSITATLVL